MWELMVGVIVGGAIGLASGLAVARYAEKQEAWRYRRERLADAYGALTSGARSLMDGAASNDWSPLAEWQEQHMYDAELAVSRLRIEDDPSVKHIVGAYEGLRKNFSDVNRKRQVQESIEGSNDAPGNRKLIHKGQERQLQLDDELHELIKAHLSDLDRGVPWNVALGFTRVVPHDPKPAVRQKSDP